MPRLVRLCGFELEVAIAPYDDSDMARAERLLDLTPKERILRHQRSFGSWVSSGRLYVEREPDRTRSEDPSRGRD